MLRLVLALGCWCVLVSAAVAQQPRAPHTPLGGPSLADVTPTPTETMWLYTQEMRRYDDPAQAVRRKAEERSQQRRDRIAALKWMGFSRQRPAVMPTPFTSFYGPSMVVDPLRLWGGPAAPVSSAWDASYYDAQR